MRKKIFEEWKDIDAVRKRKVHLTGLSMNMMHKNSGQDAYVYQYRTLDSFWAIISSDSFWATNARFSNDLEEQSLGYRKVIELMETEEIKERDLIGDCYIVCFCDENDKLSQWRGYASEGVSIGFDFTNIRPFYIPEKNGENYHKYYNSCYKVQYIDEQTSLVEFADMFDLSIVHNRINNEYLKNCAGDIIPYVKHKGFYEEAETRLVFSGSCMDMSKCIRYRENSKMKVPYIVVKMGEEESQKSRCCVVRINMKAPFSQKVKTVLEMELGKAVSIVICTEINQGSLDDKSCYGCTLRETYQVGIKSNKRQCRYSCGGKSSCYVEERNEIYISDCKQQEDIFWKVYNALQRQAELIDIKIWCEGHLPIRSVTVSSMRGKEEIAENIRHYCKNHYWLKFVEVECSKTPYRSELL